MHFIAFISMLTTKFLIYLEIRPILVYHMVDNGLRYFSLRKISNH